MTRSTGRRARCCSQEQWRHYGVGIPPIRLRLDLRVQVEQVLAEFLRIGSEVRAVGTRFAFRHLTPVLLFHRYPDATQQGCLVLGDKGFAGAEFEGLSDDMPTLRHPRH